MENIDNNNDEEEEDEKREKEENISIINIKDIGEKKKLKNKEKSLIEFIFRHIFI